MANRVLASEVQVIFQTDMSTPTVKAFIDTAHNIVEQNLVGTISNATTLIEIEKYLSAHFAALRDPRLQERRFDKSSAVFTGKTGMGLDSTYYGQTALLLDTTGKLNSLGKGKTSSKMISAI